MHATTTRPRPLQPQASCNDDDNRQVSTILPIVFTVSCSHSIPKLQGFTLHSGKSAKAGGESKRQSQSTKAGLQFPVARRLYPPSFEKGNYAQRVGAGAPGASLCLRVGMRLTRSSTSRCRYKYLAAETLELADNAARDNKVRSSLV